MTPEQRQEIMRRQWEGMRDTSPERKAEIAAAQAAGMRQRGPLTSGEQQGLRNLWGVTNDPAACFIPDTPSPTLWQRIKRRFSAKEPT